MNAKKKNIVDMFLNMINNSKILIENYFGMNRNIKNSNFTESDKSNVDVVNENEVKQDDIVKDDNVLNFTNLFPVEFKDLYKSIYKNHEYLSKNKENVNLDSYILIDNLIEKQMPRIFENYLLAKTIYDKTRKEEVIQESFESLIKINTILESLIKNELKQDIVKDENEVKQDDNVLDFINLFPVEYKDLYKSIYENHEYLSKNKENVNLDSYILIDNLIKEEMPRIFENYLLAKTIYNKTSKEKVIQESFESLININALLESLIKNLKDTKTEKIEVLSKHRNSPR